MKYRAILLLVIWDPDADLQLACYFLSFGSPLFFSPCYKLQQKISELRYLSTYFPIPECGIPNLPTQTPEYQYLRTKSPLSRTGLRIEDARRRGV